MTAIDIPASSTGLFTRMMRVKPESVINEEIAEEHQGGDGLKKTLSALAVTLFGAANVIGVGIFVVAAKASASATGSSVLVAFMLSALACAISGICYARFSSRISSSGSSYTYVYSSMGELFAFFAGLGLSCETSISSAFLARAWSSFFRKNIGHDHFGTFKIIDGIVELDLFAPLLTLFITALCLAGAKESTRLSGIMTLINSTMIACFVITAVSSSAFEIQNIIEPAQFFPRGVAGLMKATCMTFICYCGWDSVCCLSEEVKNPKRAIPRAIAGCLSLVAVLYCGVAFALCGMANYTQMGTWAAERMAADNVPKVDQLLNSKIREYAPNLSYVFEMRGIPWAAHFVSWGILLTSFSASLASAQGQPRIWFRMARDGLLPSTVGKVNAAGTLQRGILWTGVVSTLLAAFIVDDQISDVISAGVLLMQSFVCVSCLYYEAERLRGAACKRLVSWLTIAIAATAVAAGGCLQETGREPNLSGLTMDAARQAFDTAQANNAIWYYPVYAFVTAMLILCVITIATVRDKAAIVPVFAIALNFFFAGNLGFFMISMLLVVYLVASLGYMSYGLRHSRLAAKAAETVTVESN